MAILYRPVVFFIGKQAFFHLSAWKNHWKCSNQFHMRNCGGSTNTTHLVEISSHRRRNTVMKCNGFVFTFVLPFYMFFFRFLISPTDRNSGSVYALYGPNDVLRLVHVPSLGLKLLKLTLRGCLAPKKLTFDLFFHLFAAEIRSSVRGLESKLPLNVNITPHKLLFWLEVTNRDCILLILVVQPGVYFSRWLPSPLWISNYYYHFYAFGPIFTKLSESVANLITLVTVASKCNFTENQGDGCHHIEVRYHVF